MRIVNHPTPNRRQGQGNLGRGNVRSPKLPPNVHTGSGSIPVGRRKTKPHKSQPHATAPKKRPTQRAGIQPTTGVPDATKPISDVQAATNLQFAPQDTQIKQQESQIPAWYDDYLRKLQGLQTQTTQQYQGLQNQASTLAEAVHSITPEAQAAQDSRNNIVKAIQGALLQQQGAATSRNTEMAGIAGLSKTVKLGQLAQDKTKLAQLKGNFATKYATDKAQTNFENELAAKSLGVKVANAQTQRINANKKPKPETTYDKEFSKQAAKFGLSSHDWALLGPTGRAKKIQEDQVANRTPVKSIKRIAQEEAAKQAARHGYSVQDWNALTPQKRSAIIRSKDKSSSGKGSEFTWAPPGAQTKAASEASTWKEVATRLKKAGDDRPTAAKKIVSDPKAPSNPVLASAVLDAVYAGYLGRETARRLQASHFKATDIARALGIPTYTQWRRKMGRTGAARTGGN